MAGLAESEPDLETSRWASMSDSTQALPDLSEIASILETRSESLVMLRALTSLLLVYQLVMVWAELRVQEEEKG